MTKLPLEGMRVTDFCHGWAGPYMTNLLADFGAEVIKIESSKNPDARRQDPELLKKGIRGNFSLVEFSRNKKGITLNMKHHEAVELAKRLIKISDVVTENFSLRVMKSWGLDYENIKKIKPDIIMASLQGLGQTGPHREYLTWGPNLMPLMGMTYEWGFPDTPRPIGTKAAYPDFIAGSHGAVAIMAALHYRKRTGKGQYIDLAQLEATAACMPIVLLDYTVNGRIQERIGNRNRYFAPQGCYRCKGDDQWCVISIPTQEKWERFCQAIGNLLWTKDERFATILGRVKHADRLDQFIENWTINLTPQEVMQTLQEAGIAAGPVYDAIGVLHDPHLKERDFFVNLEHPDIGTVTHPNVPMKLSETPGALRMPIPRLGEHNDYVFGELLGLPKEEIERLERDEVIV
ncbi:MAG: CoA transferase [Candidatus Tectomicrobia bacterium]|nr:CoA transferase [Candidatus Tectomicrobia bacterium]